MIVVTLVTYVTLDSLFQVFAAETGNARSPRRCRLLYPVYRRRKHTWSKHV